MVRTRSLFLSTALLVTLVQAAVSCVSRPDNAGDNSMGGGAGDDGASSGGRRSGAGGSKARPTGGMGGELGATGGARSGGANSGGASSGGTEGRETGGASTGGMGGQPGETCATPEATKALALDPLTTKPVVYVLVDGSASMLENEDGFVPFESGVLPALEARNAELRLGFGYSAGVNSADCAGLTSLVSVGEDNAAEVRAAYETFTESSTTAAQSPMIQSIQQATELLAPYADEAPVTLIIYSDGDADFCDDGNPICAFDAQIAALQMAADRGVTAIVVNSSTANLPSAEWPTFLAQAGEGEQPSWGDGLNVGGYSGGVNSQCQNVIPWTALREDQGNAPHSECNGNEPDPSCYLPAGHYSETGGTATAIPFGEPSAIQADLEERLDTLLGCSFRVPSEIALESESSLELFHGSTMLPSDSWLLRGDHVTLKGTACAAWLDEPADLHLRVPCSALDE